MTSNNKKFKTFDLSVKQQKEAAGYVCYERVLYYLFSTYYKLKYFPVFYVDRFLGWNYSKGNEPIVPIYNGFSGFLGEKIYQEIRMDSSKILEEIYTVFSKGYKISTPLWLKHYSDGSPYLTSVLLEGMDQEQNVYFTKLTAVDKTCCLKLKKDEFLDKLEPDENNKIMLLIIHESDEIRKINEMSLFQAIQYVFLKLYGYSLRNNCIVHKNSRVSINCNVTQEFLLWLENQKEEFLNPKGIPKKKQFRLYVHINNKIRPLQNLLELIFQENEILHFLKKQQIQEIKDSYEKVNLQIKELLKYSSLLVRQQSEQNFNRYKDQFILLFQDLKEYQKVYEKLIIMIMTEKR